VPENRDARRLKAASPSRGMHRQHNCQGRRFVVRPAAPLASSSCYHIIDMGDDKAANNRGTEFRTTLHGDQTTSTVHTALSSHAANPPLASPVHAVEPAGPNDPSLLMAGAYTVPVTLFILPDVYASHDVKGTKGGEVCTVHRQTALGEETIKHCRFLRAIASRHGYYLLKTYEASRTRGNRTESGCEFMAGN